MGKKKSNDDELNIAFWNINEKYTSNIKNVIRHLYNQGVDLLILAEAHDEAETIKLNKGLFKPIAYSNQSIKWIRIFEREKRIKKFNLDIMKSLCRTRALFCVLEFDKIIFNLVPLHLKSKGGINQETQTARNQLYLNEILDEERKFSESTIFFGDFNHNPFESFMNATHLMNANSSKKVVETVQDQPIDYKPVRLRYNPMWNFLGDYESNQNKVQGTYYYKTDKQKDFNDFHTNMFDQIILSKPIMKYVPNKDISVIDSFDLQKKTISLMKSSIKHKNESFFTEDYSDHLPIKFTINIKPN